MLGLGIGEAVIIVLIVLLLFGPTIVAFFVGYALGQRKGGEPPEKDPARPPVAPSASAVPESPVSESAEETPQHEDTDA